MNPRPQQTHTKQVTRGRTRTRGALQPRVVVFLALFLLSVLVSLLGSHWYRNHLVEKQRKLAESFLVSKAHAITEVIHGRVALLEGVTALAQTHPAGPETSREFALFAGRVTGGDTAIRNFSLAPGGVIRYIYPLKGNEQALGLDLLHDPVSREDANRANGKRGMSLSDPLQLRQGGVGVVARQPIYSGTGVWGLASMVLDVPTLAAEAGLDHTLPFQVAVTDSKGRVFYGDAGVPARSPVTVRVDLPDGFWGLSAAPFEGWEGAVAWEVLVFRGSTVLGVSLLGLVLFLILDRQRRLHLEVRERTGALSESEEYNRTLFELSPIGLALCRMDGVLVDVNPAFATIVGRSVEETVGLSFHELTPEKYAAEERLVLDSLEASGCYGPYEKEFRHRDGHLVAVRLQGRIIGRKKERFIWSSVEDITARKRLEEELRERNEQLTLFAEHSPAAIAMLDRDLRYLIVSRRWRDDFKLGDLPIIGRCHYDLFPEIPEEWKDSHRRCLAGETEQCEEVRFPRLDGSVEWLRREVRPWRSGTGEIGGIILFSEKITERREAEAAIRREHAFSEALIDSLPGVVYLYDRELRFIRWNRNFERVVGYSGAEIAQMSPIDFFWGEEKELLQARIEEVFSKGAAAVEADFVAKGGSRTPYFFTGVRTEIDGRTCLIGIGIDISARKRLEDELTALNLNLEARVAERTRELRESRLALVNLVEDLNEKSAELVCDYDKLKGMDRLKSMFIASMSHELRTPLNSVIGYSSVLINEWLGPVSEEQKEHLGIILRAGKHLLSLINDVIDISKIEAGQIDSHADDFDLYDVLREASQQLEGEIRGKGLSFTLRNCHQQLRTDRRRLLQATLNLISNAMKYTIEGGVEVTAYADGEWVEIAVADTGIGIGESEASVIFRPFVRIDSPLRGTVSGTGLGLYLTRRLATEVLKGSVFFTSRVGEGSVFTLRIPVHPCAGAGLE